MNGTGAGPAATAPAGPPAGGGDGAAAKGRPPRDAVRARLAVCLVFALLGSVVGGWSSRIPEVRRGVGLGDASWGLANTASTAGDVVALTLITLLIGRVSVRWLSLAGASLILCTAPLLASAGTVTALLPALAAWGFSAGLLSTPMNAQAAEVERRYGRPVMSGFHACFSFGVLGGGALGTLAAAAGVTPGAQMAGNSVLLGSLLLGAARWLPDEVSRAPSGGGTLRRLRRRFTPQLLLLAAIAFVAAFVEGAAWQWSAIYAADSLGASAALAAATYTALTATAALARLGGDRLLGRLGHRRFLRLSGLVSAAGVALAVAWPHPAAALAGFAVLGLGIACMSPTVFGLAGRRPGLTAGEGVSVLVLGQWPGFLLAPPLIGALAALTGLRLALLALAAAALAAALLAARVRP
ncbi:MFS transporter [Streptomyces aidingensis]|uniref:Fucose permease n=1 Tax=Streptomyces aidingensis TaxID=910347 RepID=A0A1I1SHQ6_9ACTN|nr:MFS transporter [Streptomyces aidingensis]SFD46019.1 Fucose permease [Streptomyces aidingensis]